MCPLEDGSFEEGRDDLDKGEALRSNFAVFNQEEGGYSVPQYLIWWNPQRLTALQCQWLEFIAQTFREPRPHVLLALVCTHLVRITSTVEEGERRGETMTGRTKQQHHHNKSQHRHIKLTQVLGMGDGGQTQERRRLARKPRERVGSLSQQVILRQLRQGELQRQRCRQGEFNSGRTE